MADAKRMRGTSYSVAKKGRREQPSRKDEDKKTTDGFNHGLGNNNRNSTHPSWNNCKDSMSYSVKRALNNA